MCLHEEFEWDAMKAERNSQQHGVSCTAAAALLSDEAGSYFQREPADDTHSATADRWITLAPFPLDRNIVLDVVWTEREASPGRVTRIISARCATPQGRRAYAQHLADKRSP